MCMLVYNYVCIHVSECVYTTACECVYVLCVCISGYVCVCVVFCCRHLGAIMWYTYHKISQGILQHCCTALVHEHTQNGALPFSWECQIKVILELKRSTTSTTAFLLPTALHT